MPCSTEAGKTYTVNQELGDLVVKVDGSVVTAKITRDGSEFTYEIDGTDMNPAGAKIEFFGPGGALVFECEIV